MFTRKYNHTSNPLGVIVSKHTRAIAIIFSDHFIYLNFLYNVFTMFVKVNFIACVLILLFLFFLYHTNTLLISYVKISKSIFSWMLIYVCLCCGVNIELRASLLSYCVENCNLFILYFYEINIIAVINQSPVLYNICFTTINLIKEIIHSKLYTFYLIFIYSVNND